MEVLCVCYPVTTPSELDSASAWPLESSKFEYFPQVIFSGYLYSRLSLVGAWGQVVTW